MKVALISPYSDISSLGVRVLSSVLKGAGHETILIFLPLLEEAFFRNSMSLKYSEKVLDAVVQLCEAAELIGISLMTNYFERGLQLTDTLKAKLQVPVVWGGVHPTIKPEESIQYADIVCIGEAEEALLELVNKQEASEDILHVGGTWQKKDGRVIKNPVGPLNEGLDSLPFFDYDLGTHYVLNGNSLEAMTPRHLDQFLSQHVLPGIKGIPCYQTVTTRGCPYACSYCCNNMYQSLYKGKSYLRRRSPPNLIEELKSIKKRFSFIGAIQFSDDTIFAATEDTIEEFARLYKQEIHLPFYCLGHPLTITEKKMRDLVDAGLKCIQIGVETASENTKSLYKRRISNKRVMSTVQTVHKFSDRIFPPIYDFIVDNPYETEDELLETIHFILEFPKPYDLNIFSLTLYPGTELYRKAIKDGLIRDEAVQIYRKGWIDREKNYINLLFSLLRQKRFPKTALRILSQRSIARLFTGKLKWAVKILYDLSEVLRRNKGTLKEAAS